MSSYMMRKYNENQRKRILEQRALQGESSEPKSNLHSEYKSSEPGPEICRSKQICVHSSATCGNLEQVFSTSTVCTACLRQCSILGHDQYRDMSLALQRRDGDLQKELQCLTSDNVVEHACRQCNYGGSHFTRQSVAIVGILCTVITSGATAGFSAVFLPQLEKPNTPVELNTDIISVSTFILPLVASNFVSGCLMQRYGRRLTHLGVTIVYSIGWIMISYSHCIEFLFLGKFITGICQGLHGPLAPVYIAEITSPHSRGLILTSIPLSISWGLFISHLAEMYLHWKTAALLFSSLPMISFFIQLFVPETASWLASKGRNEESARSFFWFRGTTPTDKNEIRHIISSQQVSNFCKPNLTRDNFCKTRIMILKRPEVYRPLIIIIMFFFTSQMSGFSIVVANTTSVLQSLMRNGFNTYTAMIVVDVTRIMASTMAGLLIHGYGRKPVMMLSGFSTAILLFCLTSYMFLQRNNIFTCDILAVALFLTYIATASIGLIPLPWVMCGELFPIKYRGFGSGVGVMTSSIDYFVALKTAPILFSQIGLEGTLLFYGSVTFFGTIFLCIYLPETRDQTLLKIENNFKFKKRGKFDINAA